MQISKSTISAYEKTYLQGYDKKYPSIELVILPNSNITYAKYAAKDSRSYKVDFSKIKQQLGFETKWSLEKAIKEIYDLLKSKNFNEEDFKDKKYFRVVYIKWLIENNKIDNNLFFK